MEYLDLDYLDLDDLPRIFAQEILHALEQDEDFYLLPEQPLDLN